MNQHKDRLDAKKRFGQNFLVNAGMQLKVVSAFTKTLSQHPQTEWILEIGLGQGDISQHLIDCKLPYIGVEIDPESIEIISKKPYANDINLVQADGLQLLAKPREESIQFLIHEVEKIHNKNSYTSYNVSETLSKPGILFSSLPYNVGSRIMIEWAIHYPDTPFVVILQKEVVQKINISKKLTVFGLFLNLIFDLNKKFDISNGNFYPKPKVTSSVLAGTPKQTLPEYLNTEEKRKEVLVILKKLFSFPKKTLANNLKTFGWSPEKISEFLKKYDLPDSYRLEPETYEFIITSLLQEL